MEGISHEAARSPARSGLSKLTVIYDDNGISIDGETKGWFTDDTPERFEAYGWNVIRHVDGHDVDAVDRAIRDAHRVTDRPTLICCKTIIGKGAPHKAGTAEAHGAALGEKEVALTRVALGWTYPPFVIPDAIYSGWNARERGARSGGRMGEALRAVSRGASRARGRIHAPDARRASRDVERDRPARSSPRRTRRPKRSPRARPRSRRSRRYAKALPGIAGRRGRSHRVRCSRTGRAASRSLTTPPGNYINFGVREFGDVRDRQRPRRCTAASSRTSARSSPFPTTARNALRMAALMKLRSIFVFTHDSIGLGEDGPTHQSIEHAASLRLIPHMDVWRPCDTVETAVAWAAAIERADGPIVPPVHAAERAVPAARRGADRGDPPRRLRARRLERREREARGRSSRPARRSRSRWARARRSRPKASPRASSRCRAPASSTARTRRTGRACCRAGVPRVAVEAGATGGWRKYVGAADDGRGAIVGIDTLRRVRARRGAVQVFRLHRRERRRRGEACRMPHVSARRRLG